MDYELISVIQNLLENNKIKYNFMLENDKQSYRLFSPSFITNDLNNLVEEVNNRTNISKEIKDA